MLPDEQRAAPRMVAPRLADDEIPGYLSMMDAWTLLRLLVIAVGLTVVTPAHAQDDKAAAREAFREGTRLYDLADFAGALAAFKKAYLHYEDPALLFDIAHCYRQLGDKREALRFYRTYLRKAPTGDRAEEARRIVALLEATPDAPSPTIAAPAPRPLALAAPVATPAPRPLYKRWWVWTVAGAAVALAATAITVGVVVGQRAEDSFPTVHVP
jgi:tetratricopeptide (TPR) repeat protein